jgi:hypothetical protein
MNGPALTAAGFATITVFEGWPALGSYSCRNRNLPSRLTLVQIENMVARDEAQPEACRYAGMKAGGPEPGHTCGLARLVEERPICSAGHAPSGSRAEGAEQGSGSQMVSIRCRRPLGWYFCCLWVHVSV